METTLPYHGELGSRRCRKAELPKELGLARKGGRNLKIHFRGEGALAGPTLLPPAEIVTLEIQTILRIKRVNENLQLWQWNKAIKK